jgi:hypothetical protein
MPPEEQSQWASKLEAYKQELQQYLGVVFYLKSLEQTQTRYQIQRNY